MLPLPAPRFELAVTPVARVGFGALEREPFLLVGSACLRRDHSVLFEYRLVGSFLEFLSEQKRMQSDFVRRDSHDAELVQESFSLLAELFDKDVIRRHAVQRWTRIAVEV